MTDKMTHWDIARYANTMAVQSTIAIDPTKITVRIKNKLLKWLEQSHLDGGHRSEARKLGELLTDKFQLPTTMRTWRGLQARVTNRQMASELQELLRADWTAELLDNPHMNSGWYRDKYDEAMRLIDAANPKLTIHLYIHNREYRQPVIDCLNKYITDEDRSRIQVAIDALKGTDPIVCINYQ